MYKLSCKVPAEFNFGIQFAVENCVSCWPLSSWSFDLSDQCSRDRTVQQKAERNFRESKQLTLAFSQRIGDRFLSDLV